MDSTIDNTSSGAEQTDSFDTEITELWNDEDGTMEDTAAEPAPDSTGSEAADTAQTPETVPETDVTTEKESSKPEEEQLFTLRGERQVTQAEVLSLAEKGMDLDRVNGELDAFKALGTIDALRESADFLKELAAESGLTVPELIDSSRAAMISRKEGLDRAAAMERVRFQKRERELRGREDNLRTRETESRREREAAEERNRDFAAFVKAYPDVKAGEIPKVVWDAVRNGESLVSAYGRYDSLKLREENKELQNRVAALEQNRKNAERSAGSQQSAGKQSEAQEWERVWYEDD